MAVNPVHLKHGVASIKKQAIPFLASQAMQLTLATRLAIFSYVGEWGTSPLLVKVYRKGTSPVGH